MDFTPIETQEQLDSIIAGVRSEYADYEELKAQVGSMDGLRSELETAKAERDQHAATIQKLRIAEEYGIPSALADRLKGDNEDDLRSDAAGLAPMLRPRRKVAPLRDPDSGDFGDVSKAFERGGHTPKNAHDYY